MDDLPFIDQHTLNIAATDSEIWFALIEMLRKMMPTDGRFTRYLRCDPDQGTRNFAGNESEAIPGFRVTKVEQNRMLTLRGRHRFSEYQLTFIIEDSSLSARSYAVFPGVFGSLYKMVVIQSRAHQMMTKGLLRRVKRRCNHAR